MEPYGQCFKCRSFICYFLCFWILLCFILYFDLVTTRLTTSKLTANILRVSYFCEVIKENLDFKKTMKPFKNTI